MSHIWPIRFESIVKLAQSCHSLLPLVRSVAENTFFHSCLFKVIPLEQKFTECLYLELHGTKVYLMIPDDFTDPT